ncbi:ATP-binding cassette domain-containing protein [Clostridium sp. MCC344]|nr:ABC transporter ATP-binding protein [Clostridium sp. MCC344]MBT9788769.1 ATP-binding cassette domain-containing protein [Clostridium sp. MCC344]
MIELHNLTTGYSRDKPLLKNYSANFDKKIYGILGESGCGKTTLLRTIAGLMKPLNGEVIIDGKPVTKAFKNNVFMMHQNYTSFDWMTCLQNVLLPMKIKRTITKKDVENAKDFLDHVGLNGYENKYPKQLSGGQRQRLALARTLFAKPEIILMDEPLSALDPQTRSSMQNLVMKQHRKENNTVIIVTHSLSEAEKMCDLVINL